MTISASLWHQILTRKLLLPVDLTEQLTQQLHTHMQPHYATFSEFESLQEPYSQLAELVNLKFTPWDGWKAPKSCLHAARKYKEIISCSGASLPSVWSDEAVITVFVEEYFLTYKAIKSKPRLRTKPTNRLALLSFDASKQLMSYEAYIPLPAIDMHDYRPRADEEAILCSRMELLGVEKPDFAANNVDAVIGFTDSEGDEEEDLWEDSIGLEEIIAFEIEAPVFARPSPAPARLPIPENANTMLAEIYGNNAFSDFEVEFQHVPIVTYNDWESMRPLSSEPSACGSHPHSTRLFPTSSPPTSPSACKSLMETPLFPRTDMQRLSPSLKESAHIVAKGLNVASPSICQRSNLEICDYIEVKKEEDDLDFQNSLHHLRQSEDCCGGPLGFINSLPDVLGVLPPYIEPPSVSPSRLSDMVRNRPETVVDIPDVDAGSLNSSASDKQFSWAPFTLPAIGGFDDIATPFLVAHTSDVEVWSRFPEQIHARSTPAMSSPMNLTSSEFKLDTPLAPRLNLETASTPSSSHFLDETPQISSATAHYEKMEEDDTIYDIAAGFHPLQAVPLLPEVASSTLESPLYEDEVSSDDEYIFKNSIRQYTRHESIEGEDFDLQDQDVLNSSFTQLGDTIEDDQDPFADLLRARKRKLSQEVPLEMASKRAKSLRLHLDSIGSRIASLSPPHLGPQVIDAPTEEGLAISTSDTATLCSASRPNKSQHENPFDPTADTYSVLASNRLVENFPVVRALKQANLDLLLYDSNLYNSSQTQIYQADVMLSSQHCVLIYKLARLPGTAYRQEEIQTDWTDPSITIPSDSPPAMQEALFTTILRLIHSFKRVLVILEAYNADGSPSFVVLGNTKDPYPQPVMIALQQLRTALADLQRAVPSTEVKISSAHTPLETALYIRKESERIRRSIDLALRFPVAEEDDLETEDQISLLYLPGINPLLANAILCRTTFADFLSLDPGERHQYFDDLLDSSRVAAINDQIARNQRLFAEACNGDAEYDFDA